MTLGRVKGSPAPAVTSKGRVTRSASDRDLPCPAAGSRTGPSRAEGGTGLGSCRCRESWGGTPSRTWGGEEGASAWPPPTLLPQPLCAAGPCCVDTRGRHSPRTCPHPTVSSPSLLPPARQPMGRCWPSAPPPLAPRARLGSPQAATLLPSLSLTPVAPSTHHWGDGWLPCHGPGYLHWLKDNTPRDPQCPGALASPPRFQGWSPAAGLSLQLVHPIPVAKAPREWPW